MLVDILVSFGSWELEAVRGDDGDAQRGVRPRASCCREQRRGALVVCITHQNSNRCFPSHVLCSRIPEQRQRQAGQRRSRAVLKTTHALY